HITIRYYNKLIKAFFDNFEKWFKNNISKFDKQTQGGYVKGLIDSEGTVYSSGRSVILMQDYSILDFASNILGNLNIKYNYTKRNNQYLSRLAIYGPATEMIKYCCPIHNGKRYKIENAPHILGRARVPQQRLTQGKVYKIYT
ncbi:unnamed protein product, partial [marine sediment metagenome]